MDTTLIISFSIQFILIGTLFVMICTVIVYFADNENITKYVDPVISIISGITLLVLSYPYSKFFLQFVGSTIFFPKQIR